MNSDVLTYFNNLKKVNIKDKKVKDILSDIYVEIEKLKNNKQKDKSQIIIPPIPTFPSPILEKERI